MFANGPGDLGSIPGRVIPKTQKMVLDASLLSTQHYKVRIKGKVEQSRKGVAPSPTHWCSSYRKGSLRVTLDYGRQLYFTFLWYYTHTYIYIYIYISYLIYIYIQIYIYIYIYIYVCVCVCVYIWYICLCIPPDRTWHKVSWSECRSIVGVTGGSDRTRAETRDLLVYAGHWLTWCNVNRWV